MNHFIRITAALLTVIAYSHQSQATLHPVSISGTAYSPSHLMIHSGDTVRWTNNDGENRFLTTFHAEFWSGVLTPGQTYTRVFTGPGSYLYVDLYDQSIAGIIDCEISAAPEWSELHAPFFNFGMQDIVFADEQHGWASNGLGVARTSDGGQSWQQVNTNEGALALSFVDGQSGWAAGDDGVIHHTANGGVTWSQQYPGTGEVFRDIFFLDAQRGWACGWEGLWARTDNGGATWTLASMGHGYDLRSLHMLTTQEGFMVANGNRIYRTTNGAISWQLQLDAPGGNDEHFADLFAFDNQHLWTCGSAGNIYRSTDGGANWEAMASGTTRRLRNIAFTSAADGWVVGDSGYVARTSDGGESWNVLTPPAWHSITSVYFLRGNLGFFTTDAGRIFRWSSDEPENTNPNTLSRADLPGPPLRNYPNPFNPETTIEFAVQSPGLVQLEVFDILGRSVAVLLNQPMAAGVHTQRFAGSGLASGRYYYRLTTSDGIQTRLMTLLK